MNHNWIVHKFFLSTLTVQPWTRTKTWINYEYSQSCTINEILNKFQSIFLWTLYIASLTTENYPPFEALRSVIIVFYWIWSVIKQSAFVGDVWKFRLKSGIRPSSLTREINITSVESETSRSRKQFYSGTQSTYRSWFALVRFSLNEWLFFLLFKAPL